MDRFFSVGGSHIYRHYTKININNLLVTIE
jgi:hypothetical protein